MQSKQQKQIKVFLIQTFGGSRGGSLFSQMCIRDSCYVTRAGQLPRYMKDKKLYRVFLTQPSKRCV